jgi:hypothetical protein
LRTGIVEVRPRSTAYSNPAHDVAADLNRQATAEDQNFSIHVCQRLQGGHLPDELCELGRRTP